MRKSDAQDGCWIWTGRIYDNGYGQFHEGTCREDYRTVLAHQFSYRLHKGVIPDGLEIDHLCRNRRCINPDHLEAVTHAVNVRRGGNTIKTHCPKGHPYDETNTHIDAKGSRHCRTCNTERARLRYRRLHPTASIGNAYKTHCKHGHEFTSDNTYVKPNGRRECRECNRERCRNRNRPD